jgi:hypothetical protein
MFFFDSSFVSDFIKKILDGGKKHGKDKMQREG